MKRLLQILNHRDFILSLAVVTGLILGNKTSFLADISLYLLMLAMTAATINFSFKTWKSPANLIRPILLSVLLNYFLYGFITLLCAYFLFYNTGKILIWTGFVIIVAAPPGPAVIPFSAMLNGDNNFSTTGLFGLYILAMVLTPVILLFFIGTSVISPLMIFNIMVMLIVIPLIISRFLRHPRVFPYCQKSGGTVIKWLFFLIITPIIGMNRHVFFEDFNTFINMSAVFFINMFILGFVYNIIMIKFYPQKSLIISSTFMMVIKSAAFAAVVSFNFFKDEPIIAMPAAVLSLFIILFTIFYSFMIKLFFQKFSKP